MLFSIAPQLAALTVTLFVTLWLSVYTQRYKAKCGRVLPPGPPGVPLLGSLLDIPGKHLGTYFRRLLREYGGLASVNLVGFRLILIGDIKVAKELLEKHSAKHSSRPVVHYIRNHVDPVDAYWLVSKGGKNHTIARKLAARLMSTVKAGETEPLHEFEATLNVRRLLDNGGQQWYNHMCRIAASSVFAAAFGMHCPTGQESELKEVLNVNAEAVILLAPSASIVNVFPFLDLLPGPMPWRTRAQIFRRREAAVYEKLINDAVTGKASNMHTWAAEFAREDKPEGDQRILLKQFTGAAIETTSAALQTFVLACIRYPEWIATAQREIDAVVGTDRLPSFKDRPFLPYVEAIIRETLRWRPAGQEYFIPEGSILFPVTWAIEHDLSRFEYHDRFMPERFLDAEGNLKPDYETSAFGFGRRVCPGIPFAERTLWINIATMLWTFNIRGSDEIDPKTGRPFCYDDSDDMFTGELTSCPRPFPAVFEPRSLQRAEIAKKEWDECEKDLNVLLPKPKEK